MKKYIAVSLVVALSIVAFWFISSERNGYVVFFDNDATEEFTLIPEMSPDYAESDHDHSVSIQHEYDVSNVVFVSSYREPESTKMMSVQDDAPDDEDSPRPYI